MAPSEIPPLQRRLTAYLMNELTDADGAKFIKSRHIATDLDASVKRIGQAMATLEDDDSVPVVLHRRGGNSNGTTWKVDRPRTFSRR